MAAWLFTRRSSPMSRSRFSIIATCGVSSIRKLLPTRAGDVLEIRVDLSALQRDPCSRRRRQSRLARFVE
ncbi:MULTISPECIES: hypothetical protein [unclassified Bradyrhizobium]